MTPAVDHIMTSYFILRVAIISFRLLFEFSPVRIFLVKLYPLFKNNDIPVRELQGFPYFHSIGSLRYHKIINPLLDY